MAFVLKMQFIFLSQYFSVLLYILWNIISITLNKLFSNLKSTSNPLEYTILNKMLCFDNNTDSNKTSGAHFYCLKMFVLTIIKKRLYYITLSYIYIHHSELI